MKELSQKPDYEMMWNIECELNKKLQEQNKTMREALEFYAEIKNYDYIEQYNNTYTVIDPVDCERFVDKWHDVTFIGGKRAREALAKVKE